MSSATDPSSYRTASPPLGLAMLVYPKITLFDLAKPMETVGQVRGWRVL